MRRILLALLLCAVAGSFSPAWAAPTCQDRSGNTVHCGTANAMPLGWTAPEADRHFPGPDRGDAITAAAIVVLLLLLIGLLPDFGQEQWGNPDRSDDPKDDRRI